MKSIYKYYKERLIEISGKNRSLYSKNLSKKYAYDIGLVLGKDKEEFDEFYSFLWNGKRSSYELINKNIKDRVFENFNLEGKVKARYADIDKLSTEEKRNENLRRERLKKEEIKKTIASQVTALRGLKREVEEFSKETGRYELFIGYPFVTGKVNKDLLIKGPLLLFPVIINVEDEMTVSIEAKHDESIQLNKVLLLAYAKEHRLNCENLIMEFESLLDSKLKNVQNVIDYLAKFSFKIALDENFDNGLIPFDKIVEAETSKHDKMKVVNSCVIGRFPLANSIYNDYTLLERKRLTTDAIDELLEGKTFKKNKKTDTRTYSIDDLDYAQENAIAQLQQSGNMVIYGPPGTGKSQTIVNVISDALCKNKKILVVSQKKAALDVVFNRLKSLNSKCMFITDAEKNKTDFYDRCNKMHREIVETFKDTSYDEEYKAIEKALGEEVEQLKTISDVLFSKTPFGLNLQQMYSNSANIGKNTSDYRLYQEMLKNKFIMSLDYKRLYELLRVIREKNKGKLYYRYIVLKRTNPLIDHIKSDVEIHIINQLKAYLSELIKKNIVPFDSGRYSHSRLVMVYSLENEVDDDKLKPLVKMLSKLDFPQLHKRLKFSKFFLPAYPFVKSRLNKVEKAIEEHLVSTIEAIKNYVSDYSLLEKVLDKKGYLMTVDNISNGNTSYLKLLLSALDDYVEIRDVNVSLRGLSNDERDILNFAYVNSQNEKQFLEVLDKLLETRVYHETITYEEKNQEKLSKIIDFENIRNRIISLQEDKKNIDVSICQNKFKGEYLEYYNKSKESKNYLYQITKQQGLMPIRSMMELYSEFLLKLFPCWLLSPESVSMIFPLNKNMFDLILFDEASQVFIENTLPTIYRGKNIVVAGDSKQLRPTATFMKRYMGNDSDEELDLATIAALEVESLLDLATSRYNSTNLTYHYRSKNEELINFSNYAFYDGKLQIAPNITKNSKSKPIERIKVDGKWINRKNQEEANAIVALLKKLLKGKKNKSSIGIITFNTEQEMAIEDAIDEECQNDPAFRDAYLKERNRKENGEDISLFIKNLENVQGDERDIIIFSIGYAQNEYGKVVAHFGPLSVEGGENRLNVAITRAKEKIYVVTSIEPEELLVEGTKNLGPKIFKNYLKYVRAVSDKKENEVQYILDAYKPTMKTSEDEVKLNQFENDIKAELVKLGYEVETNLGNSNYKISLAIYDKTIDKYLLGIECDHTAYNSSSSILERDVYRNKFLASRGWKILRVWSRDWWLNKNKVISKIVKIANANKRQFEKSSEEN